MWALDWWGRINSLRTTHWIKSVNVADGHNSTVNRMAEHTSHPWMALNCPARSDLSYPFTTEAYDVKPGCVKLPGVHGQSQHLKGQREYIVYPPTDYYWMEVDWSVNEAFFFLNVLSWYFCYVLFVFIVMSPLLTTEVSSLICIKFFLQFSGGIPLQV